MIIFIRCILYGMVDLLPGEKIVKTTYISRVARVYYYIAAAALLVVGAYLALAKIALPLNINSFYLTVIFVAFGLGLIIFSEVRKKYHKYTITSRRVIKESGILKSEVTAWEHTQIINVKVYQSLLGRLTGFGTVDVILTGNNNLFLESVSHPEKLMELISELVENRR